MQSTTLPLLETLIDIVTSQGGSDLHLSVGRVPVIRVAGSLIPIEKLPPLKKEDIESLMALFFSSENMREFALKKESNFAYMHTNGIRFRGNAFLGMGHTSIALRLVPSKIRTFQELNLPDILERFTKMQQGFFLVVGPAGQGKSTTLATMIDTINQDRLEHIVTIEDPIEFVFEPKKSLIDQREVKTDTPDSHTALWGAFRQDADVIMIGEMREPETIAAAVTAAETGHFVLSTLHTNTAAQTVDRIIDSFPAGQQDQIRAQLSLSLAGIFSIRLVPRVSGGLIPAYELVINNNAISNLIREGRTHEIDAVIETSSEEGMIDLDRSLADLVRRGEITVESARLHASSIQSLQRMM